jgi:hypothetical protein
MSVKLTLSPRHAVALARAAARSAAPSSEDERDALAHARRRLERRISIHGVEDVPEWGTNAQGRPR